MQSDDDNLLQHLYRAVLVLASAEGRIQERLGQSYGTHLCHIDAKGLPASVQQDFVDLCEELKQIHTDSTTRERLTETRAGELARRIIMVYDAVLKTKP